MDTRDEEEVKAYASCASEGKYIVALNYYLTHDKVRWKLYHLIDIIMLNLFVIF